MRILFLVHTVDWLETGGGPYHGAGWTGALIRSVLDAGHEAAVVYQTSRKKGFIREEDGVRYFAVPSEKRTLLGKFGYYYGGYRQDDGAHLLPGLHEAVGTFRPELIHLFGIENPLSVILGETDVPVALHLQGLLGPVSEAYCPPGITRGTFRRRFPLRETLLRNGHIYALNSLAVRARRERERLGKARWVLGRTAWDREYAAAHGPQARYFHVDEILRAPFYEKAGAATYDAAQPLRLVSTLSETMYKGFDLVLRAARRLQDDGVAFEWTVIGMGEDSSLKRFFEKETGIRCADAGIRLVGCLDAEKLAQTLLQAGVYVHPSYVDNSPNSLCEAQLLGLPCVACRVGGIPSLVEDGKTGLLTPAGDPDALAACLRGLQDAAARERLGRAAAEAAARRHDPETILRDLLEAYHSILQA